MPLKQICCRALRIRFDRKDDEKTMRMWMGAHRLTYNAAVKLVRGDRRWADAQGQYLAEQLVNVAKNGRTTKTNTNSTQEDVDIAAEHAANMETKRKSLGVDVGAFVRKHPWLQKVHYYIRKNAVRDVVKAESSNEGMRKTDPRHSWTLRLKKRSNPSAWTIGVSKDCISEVSVEPRPDRRRPRKDGKAHPEEDVRNWTRVTICPNYKFPSFWLNEEVPGGVIDKDCKITVDARGRFYMVVPYEIGAAPPTTPSPEKRRVGAVDPGDRVQATVYSPSDGEVVQYAVGKEGGGKDAIFKVCEKIDQTAALANKPENHESVSRRRELRARLARLRARARNLVTEARNKIALDMSVRWDTLILPPFETGGMVRRKQANGLSRKLHSKVARSLMSWRHYDFAVHVKNVFLHAGGEVVSPDERYTTMCCGVCGVLNEKHSNEQWTCKNPNCTAFHLRDPAASRCIFLKCLECSEATGQLQPTSHQAYDPLPIQSDGGEGREDVRSDVASLTTQ
jgi:transposase